MLQPNDEIIPIAEFCRREGKSPRAARRLYKIHAGLKFQVKGERGSRINYSHFKRICAAPKGYIKLKK